MGEKAPAPSLPAQGRGCTNLRVNPNRRETLWSEWLKGGEEADPPAVGGSPTGAAAYISTCKVKLAGAPPAPETPRHSVTPLAMMAFPPDGSRELCSPAEG